MSPQFIFLDPILYILKYINLINYKFFTFFPVDLNMNAVHRFYLWNTDKEMKFGEENMNRSSIIFSWLEIKLMILSALNEAVGFIVFSFNMYSIMFYCVDSMVSVILISFYFTLFLFRFSEKLKYVCLIYIRYYLRCRSTSNHFIYK